MIADLGYIIGLIFSLSSLFFSEKIWLSDADDDADLPEGPTILIGYQVPFCAFFSLLFRRKFGAKMIGSHQKKNINTVENPHHLMTGTFFLDNIIIDRASRDISVLLGFFLLYTTRTPPCSQLPGHPGVSRR